MAEVPVISTPAQNIVTEEAIVEAVIWLDEAEESVYSHLKTMAGANPFPGVKPKTIS